MRIGRAIASSFVLHTLFLSATLLFAQSGVIRPKVFFVELKEGIERALPRGDEGTVERALRKETATKKAPALPPHVRHGEIPKRMEQEPLPAGVTESPSDDGGSPALPSSEELAGMALPSGQGHDLSGSGPGKGQLPAGPTGVSLIEVSPGGYPKGHQGALLQIRTAIEKATVYPTLARKRRQEGTVVAAFTINAGGLPERVTVIRSSGFSLLDSAARETITRAAPFPPVQGNIEVPITFRLRSEDR